MVYKIAKIENQQQLSDFKDFISSITKQSNIAILHDTDADGLSSLAVTQIALKRLNLPLKKVSPKHHGKREITDEYVNELKKDNITHIIILDLPAEDFPGIDLLSSFNLMVIDHHPITAKKILDNITLIKPDLFQSEITSSKVCTANIAYLFFSQLINLEDIDWIAAIGILGDITYKVEKEFVDKVFNKLNIEHKDNIFESEFGKLVNYVTNSNSTGVYEDLIYAQKCLVESKDFFEAKTKLEKFKVVEDELHSLVDNFPKDATKIGQVYFYEIKPKYFLGSVVSTITSLKKLPEDVLVVLEDHNDKLINISARCQNKKYDMGKMMAYATKDLKESNGGGHIPAAGGNVLREDKEKFKQRVIEWIGEQNV